MKYLIVIVGPTAVGKTAMSIEIARHFDTEVLSADSRQFYKEMTIGTAKPDAEEMGEVVHHFINSRSIDQDYDVGAYEKEALACLDGLYQRRDVAILVGGSGLFVDAVCRGFDELPRATPEIRQELIDRLETEGIEALRTTLQEVDPTYYEQVDLNNPQRLMRALEVYQTTGEPFSSFRKGNSVQRPFEVIKVGLEMERAKLYERIDQRMDMMIESGLFEEAKALWPKRELNALQTVGYREIYGFMAGDYDKEEAIRLLKRNSRRYAKRQMTWFKRDQSTAWFEAGDKEAIIAYLGTKTSLEGSETKK